MSPEIRQYRIPVADLAVYAPQRAYDPEPSWTIVALSGGPAMTALIPMSPGGLATGAMCAA